MTRAASLFGIIVIFAAGGADWPQFRGPTGTGFVVGTPPVKWTDTDGVKWKTALPGPGSSSPIIVGDRAFVTCYSGYGVDAANPGNIEKLTRHLVCVNRFSGKILWTKDVVASDSEDKFSGYLNEHGYASNTPATDGEAIYAFFSKAGVVALDLDGKTLWQTSVGTESDERRWGSSASVILHKNLVIVNAASEGRAIVALDKTTGKQVWKADGKRLSLSFSTPALVEFGDRTDLVVAMPGEVWGINPDTGKLLWYATIKPSGNVCPGVIGANGTAYITGGFQTKGTIALKVGGSGDVTEKNTLWAVNKSSYVPTPVLHEGRLLNVTEDGFAVSMKAENGAVVYEERLSVKGVGGRGSRPFYASPVAANGHLYAVSRRSGVYVLKIGDKFELLQQNAPLDDSDFNATPAIVGKQLFLRSNKFLYCLEAQ